ncbi:MAG: Slp family lipoprotein [Nitrospirota bacterium]|jgi:outer membrane lipoprotein
MRWVLLSTALLITACATTPPPLATGPYATLDHADALSDAGRGQRVRWGGSIVATTPGEEESCFEIIAHPLDRRGRPLQTDTTAGRFMACAPGFFDPEVYRFGREVTIVGVVGEPRSGKIGEYTYHYPELAAEIVYLWPEREDRYWDYYPDPFWYPYWPYYHRPWW